MKAAEKLKSRFIVFLRAATALLVLAAGGWGFREVRALFLRHPYFALRDIQVVTDSDRTRPEEIVQLLHLRKGQSLWAVSLKEVRDQVERDPRVESASARREFPHRLILDVRERRPVAIVVLDHLYYADGHGVLFKRIGRHDPADYPVLTGLSQKGLEEGDEDTRSEIGRCIEFLQLYREENLPFPISEVRVERGEGITFFLRDHPLRVKVGIGYWSERLRKLTRVMAVWDKRESEISSIDLSFSRQAIVRLRPQAHPEPKRTVDRPDGQARRA